MQGYQNSSYNNLNNKGELIFGMIRFSRITNMV
jgi:hypothetical protein